MHTVDWFSPYIPTWRAALSTLDSPMVGELHALEIGCLEGRATVWLLENALVHPSSSITVVDTFAGSPEFSEMAFDVRGMEERFDTNIAPHAHKVRKIKATSAEALRRLDPASFDLIYVDGSHRACDVLEDAVLSWRLLRPGGILIFDDYGWTMPESALDRPKIGIDAFLFAFDGQYAVLHHGYQMILKKR